MLSQIEPIRQYRGGTVARESAAHEMERRKRTLVPTFSPAMRTMAEILTEQHQQECVSR